MCEVKQNLTNIDRYFENDKNLIIQGKYFFKLFFFCKNM